MILSTPASLILSTICPILGSAIDGPLSIIVARQISNCLLGKPDGTPKEISSAIILATSEQLVLLKGIEVEFNKLSPNPIHSVEKATDWTPKFIAMITITSFFTYIGLVTFYPFERPLPMEFVNLAIGWIGGVATAIVSYYFGSSSGSKQKSDIIERMEPRPIDKS